MAPKRKRGPPKVTTVKFEGDAEELARLLAWLDLKKEFRIEREIFKTRIVEYFRKRHHRDYTWDSVDNILHSIHNKGHRDDNIKWTNRRMMLEEGTACLVVQDRHKWLDETTVLALEISEQLKLDESFRTEFIQSTGFRNTSATMSRERSLVSPSRSLRSRSANAGTDPSNGHEVEPIANRQRLVPVRARQGRLASESSSSLPSVSSIGSRARTTARVKSKDSSPKARQDKVVLDSEESGVDNKVKICPSPHGKASTNDAHQTTAARPCARKKTAKRLLHSRATQISQQCSVSEATIRELEESRDRLESECVSLRNKLNYVEEELKTRIDCWKSVQRDRDFNLALQGQQLTISSLNEEIKILRGQATFIRPLDIDGVQSRLVQMRQLFDDIAYHAGKAFLGYARLPEDLPGRLAQARDAQDLLRHTITGREDGAMTLNEVGETINSMSSHHVLRGILASALCESVFESDWPNFDRTHSQLLRAKETCIELQEDGPKALEILDLAAHHLLLSEAAFTKSMLPLKRDEVTYRIVSALSALIGPHLEIASTDKKLIQEAVQRTLEIKAKALTIPRTIIVSTVKSGTTFDPDLMEAEFEEAYPVATLNGGAPVVKMCLFPALYFDERDRRADELSAGAGPVCQKMQVADASEQNTSHIKILTKAVVLLEE